MKTTLLLSMLLLVGCRNKAEDDPGADGGDGADGADGSDGSDGSDGGDGTIGEEATLNGSVAVPPGLDLDGPLVVAAIRMDFGEGPLAGDVLAWDRVEADGSFSLDLPARPPDADLSDFEPDLASGAIYMLHAFEAEEMPVEDDAILRGLSLDRLVVFIDEGGFESWPQGWTLADSGLSGMYEDGTRCLLDTTRPLTWRQAEGYPDFHPVEDEVELPLRGLQADLSLGGTLTDLDPSADGVAGLWSKSLGGTTGLGALFDTSVDSAGSFSVTLSDPAPESTIVSSDPDWRYSAAFILPYVDMDESGDWTDGDDALNHTVCLDDEWVVLRYNMPVRNYRGYRFLDCYQTTAGWQLATAAEDETWTEWHGSEEAMALEGSPETCPLFAE